MLEITNCWYVTNATSIKSLEAPLTTSLNKIPGKSVASEAVTIILYFRGFVNRHAHVS